MVTIAETSTVDIAGSARQLSAPPDQLDDLTPGLLIFFARPSMLQTFAEFFGHEWRHVGVTVQTDQGLMVASYCPRKCFRLDDPFEIMGAYDRVGVARVFPTDVEVATVEAFCRRFEHLERADSPYAYSAILVGPIHLMARRRRSGALRRFLLALVHLYCRLQQARFADRTALTCSTLAWAAVHDARDLALRIPLSAHPDDEAAYATQSTARDELFARWLCGPTELWQAISPHNRVELDLTTIDLREGSDSAVEATPKDEAETYIDMRDDRPPTPSHPPVGREAGIAA